MQHINFLYKKDFFDSLNAVMEREQTPVLIYDRTGALNNHIKTYTWSNLVDYSIDFKKDNLKRLINNRIANQYDYIILFYVLDPNFKISDELLTLCANVDIYFRILTPKPILKESNQATIYNFDKYELQNEKGLNDQQKEFIIKMIRSQKNG